MRNIWHIIRGDARRICRSVVAIVVIMGLCIVPCLYAWFNIFSNWDPYGTDASSLPGLFAVSASTRRSSCPVDSSIQRLLSGETSISLPSFVSSASGT